MQRSEWAQSRYENVKDDLEYLAAGVVSKQQVSFVVCRIDDNVDYIY